MFGLQPPRHAPTLPRADSERGYQASDFIHWVIELGSLRTQRATLIEDRAELRARYRAQIDAGPNELVDLVEYDSRGVVVEAKMTLDARRDRDAARRLGRKMRDRRHANSETAGEPCSGPR
jgi:hypothetical protein